MSSALFIGGMNQHRLPSKKVNIQIIRKNFDLSSKEFDQMVAELQEGNRTIFEQVFLTHFESCMLFLQRRFKATHNDAYDSSMETMLLFMKRLKAGKIVYGNLQFLFTQMAGQVYLKWIKKIRILEENIELPDVPDLEEESDEQLFVMLDHAYSKLSKENQAMLRAFYFDGVSMKELAERYGVSAAALRKRKQRCLEGLRGVISRGP